MNDGILKGKRRKNAGFTLIELLVVVLIIGILAAIAVPQYFAVIEKGHFAEATACMDPLNGSEIRFALTGSVYSTVANVTSVPGSANNPLDTGCDALNYFSGAIAVGAGSYTMTLTRNGTSFSTTSGAGAGYTVTLGHVDPDVHTWGGTVPASWLPQ
jgi:prepilin-type N-terminal cleavage/methylation domain-containing protein